MAEVMADPAKIEEMKAMADATFQAADTDGDGKLNLAEYMDFSAKTRQNSAAAGVTHPETSDAELEQWWNMLVTIAGTPDGISKADHDSITAQIKQAVKAKMAQ